MIRLVILVAVIVALFILIRHYGSLDAPSRKRFWWRFSFALLLVAVVFLTITGRLHYIAAIATAVLPFARRLVPLLRHIPLLRRLYREHKGRNESENAGAKVSAAVADINEAYEVLGLAPGASKQDVIDAHRKLMQKFHPDRGGNDYLAARINQAKDLLLEHL